MWEERYSGSKDYVFGTAPARFLLDHDQYLTAGNSALAVADGEGRNSVHMAQKGLSVTALEFAPTAIARAHALAKANSVTLDIHQTDVLRDPWPAATYDLVAGIFIQFVGPDGRRIQFQRMKDATKPGGLVMLHGYRPEQIELGTGGPPFRENMYTDVILRAAFVGWEVLECHSYEKAIHEGRGHSGVSALIDFVARKPEA